MILTLIHQFAPNHYFILLLLKWEASTSQSSSLGNLQEMLCPEANPNLLSYICLLSRTLRDEYAH